MHSVSAIKIVSIRTAERNTTDRITIQGVWKSQHLLQLTALACFFSRALYIVSLEESKLHYRYFLFMRQLDACPSLIKKLNFIYAGFSTLFDIESAH